MAGEGHGAGDEQTDEIERAYLRIHCGQVSCRKYVMLVDSADGRICLSTWKKMAIGKNGSSRELATSDSSSLSNGATATQVVTTRKSQLCTCPRAVTDGDRVVEHSRSSVAIRAQAEARSGMQQNEMG